MQTKLNEEDVNTPQMEFNFRKDILEDANLESLDVLAEQLDEMGWKTTVTYPTATGGLRIELTQKPERKPSPDDTLERISGTLLRCAPAEQVLA